MLKKYHQLFKELNLNNISYVVYKGIEHLNEELNGFSEGDIDIFVDKEDFQKFEEIIKNNNLFKVFKTNFPFYYFGIDSKTHKFIMVDATNKIRLGHKPHKPYSFTIDIKKLKKQLKNGVWVLDNQDYSVLFFLLKITSNSSKITDLKLLQKLVEENKNNDGCLINVIEKIISSNWKQIKKDILNAKSWLYLHKKYHKKIISNVKKNTVLNLKQYFQKSIFFIKILKNKLFKTIFNRIRKKGKLLVFIGVDGSGKSSTVAYISQLNYFKKTGVKTIYFGNNKYAKPITWALKKYKKKQIRPYIQYLADVDKIVRSIKACYYIKKGYLVLADRFYYDDLLHIDTIKPNKNIIKRFLFFLIKPRVWIKPDLTFFLDVSPDIAYKRKQDFSYEKMQFINKNYKNYMSNLPNVITVNADQNQQDIYTKIIREIIQLDKRENNK